MPMRLNRLFRSLRFKTTLAVTGALIVLLSATSVLWYERHRGQELNSAQAQAAFTSDLIEAALHDVMRTQDSTDLRDIIANVGKQPGVKALYLLDADNQVRFSSQSASTVPPLDPRAPSRLCPAERDQPQPNGIMYTDAAGEQVLRYCRPIVNQPDCQGCHSPQQPILGTLISDYTSDEINQFLDADLRDTLLIGIGALASTILATQVLFSHLALGKLERFAPILHRFGAGDLSARLPLQGEDEIEQLAASFNRMADSLQTREQENARLYQELQEKEAARTQLLQQIIAAQEEDRKRLSRGLHDDFSQSLTALTMTLQSALQTIPPGDSPLRQQLEQLQMLTVDTLGEASRWIQDLRPRLLDDMGLVPAIRSYAESRLEASGTAVDVQARGLEQRLPPEIETTLFRVIQEAVSNIAKHSHARHARIGIELYESGQVVARVEDDGVGFVPGKYLHATEGLRGVGLLSMRERVALLSGTLMIESTPGRGTLVRVEVPWKPSPL
jgi:signal transduction histidine kinase